MIATKKSLTNNYYQIELLVKGFFTKNFDVGLGLFVVCKCVNLSLEH